MPSDAELKTLEMYLGMVQTEAGAMDTIRGTIEGGKMKEVGTVHWQPPNTGATNESGFSGLPGGYRVTSGTFYSGIQRITFIIRGIWWSSTEYSPESNLKASWVKALCDDHARIYRGGSANGFAISVHCIRD